MIVGAIILLKFQNWQGKSQFPKRVRICGNIQGMKVAPWFNTIGIYQKYSYTQPGKGFARFGFSTWPCMETDKVYVGSGNQWF